MSEVKVTTRPGAILAEVCISMVWDWGLLVKYCFVGSFWHIDVL